MDISHRFHISPKLYGRAEEIIQILTTFERVSQGSIEMMLVSGDSGTGKSTLVNQIFKPITGERGYFISGKFDQLQRDIPYAAITQAWQNFIHQIFGENEVTQQTWRQKILGALGNHGQIMIDLIPELEKIIGKQLPIEQLEARENENRFNLFFLRFVDIFTTKEHPLVIFLDDLQWADLPSLNLIQLLMTNAHSQYLLIICAYRNNEINSTHPLGCTLEQIKQAGARVNQISLRPWEIKDINQLIADTLNSSIEYTKPLAKLLSEKTGGNAFFLTQFIEILYQEKLLTFNHSGSSSAQKWQWDIEQIQKLDITDNVIELIIGKLRQLDENTQNILKLAACIGNQFNLEILSIINEKSPIITSQELASAIQERLIIPLSSNPLISQYPESITYKFSYHQVQQVAYSLTIEEDQKKNHLRIGRLIGESLQKNQLMEHNTNIFHLVYHLNQGAELITEQLERDELAKFYLQAAKRSKSLAGYEPALKYTADGMRFLSSNSWDDQYQLAWELHRERLELLYLNNKFEQFEELAVKILEKAQDTIDRAKINQLKIVYYFTILKPDQAIDTILATLREFSLNISQEFDYIGKKIEKQQDEMQLFFHEVMKIWVNCSPENFQHKYDLVAAEKARILGQNWRAGELYEQAIQGAKQNQFIYGEALAYERAGAFYLNLGREEIGQLYLKNAHSSYTSWGDKAKVKQLETAYPQYFIGGRKKRVKDTRTTVYTTTNNAGDVLDVTTVIKASQTMAREIVLGNLLTKLMKIMIENAGAEKGFLLLRSPGKLPNNQDEWVIEATGEVNTDDVTVLQSIPLDYIDPSRQTPLLAIAIINYVIHTEENLVLTDASVEGQFTRDRYITTAQPKSILCAPLLNQGKLSGILYLENNLITGAFTPERLEVLNILSSQAAISIENSRLYATLEDKVAERTQELSQALEMVQATQAKLEFENALLKTDVQASTYAYQVGGSLSSDAPTYVVRSADRYLYKALLDGHFCYILNSRQMGKSSLMVRMMHHLQQEGVCCAAIDMTRLGSEDITPDQWYKGLAVELWQSFDLIGKFNLRAWWKEQLNTSPVQLLSRFFQEVILGEVKFSDHVLAPKIVIFLDEIDSLLGLKFAVNDFFALIRSCYNQRAINPDYKRLCFVLLGVATPSDLITDHRRTPFNIGQAIQLQGFKLDEAQPLLQGLTDKVSNSRAVLKEVLFWTNGQPFLTQKICLMIRNSSSTVPEKGEKAWIEHLVRTNIIENWQTQDEPEHIRTICDRVLKGEGELSQKLALYQQILEQGQVSFIESIESRELILSGLLIKQAGYLYIHNRIYELIFNNNWVAQHI